MDRVLLWIPKLLLMVRGISHEWASPIGKARPRKSIGDPAAAAAHHGPWGSAVILY